MKKFYTILIALLVLNVAIAQWTQQNSSSPNNLHSVFFTDANTGYAVGDSGTILKTNNAGTSWITLPSGTTKNLYSVQFPEANIGYAVGGNAYQAGIILKTTNGGTTWSALSSGITFPLHSVYFTDANTGYVVGDSSSIIKTINGGTTWVAGWSGMTANVKLLSVYFTDAKKGYAAGGNTITIPNGAITLNVLLETEDGGTTWGDPEIGSYGSLFSVYCPDSNTCYAVGGNLYYRPPYSEVVKMTNGVEDITIQLSKSNFGLRSIYFTDANTGYAVGLIGTILKTKNGADWAIQNSGTSTVLNSVYFTDANTGYAVGDFGIILKTTNGGNSLGVNDQSSTVNSLKIYPNPSLDNITIETSATPTKGELSILNLNGQELMTRHITQPTTTFDVSNLPSGVYEVKMVGEKGVQLGKFIKQ
jgi:photosystem II stability/assembly factor-like uncharacterized protein